MAKNSVLNVSIFQYKGKTYAEFFRHNSNSYSIKPKIVSKKNAKYIEKCLLDMQVHISISGSMYICAFPKS